MTLSEIERVLGRPTVLDRKMKAEGPVTDGRIHVDLSSPIFTEQHYAVWACMLPQDGSIPPGTRESIGRYCLAVEEENGNWRISASCALHGELATH